MKSLALVAVLAGVALAQPESLDAASVRAGVAAVKDKITACGDGTHGKVKVQVKVSPDGTVADVKIDTAMGKAVGKCVAGVMLNATFAKTDTGGSFGYPFVF